MHRGPWKRARGSGPARRSPARTHTLAHAPSWKPGRGSAPGQQRRRAPAATHAERPGRGRRAPPSPRSPPSAPSPPPRPLLSPPPPLARAPAPPSARARLQRMPRARDPRLARDVLTPTREEPRQEKAETGLMLVAGAPRQWPAPPPPPPLRQAGPGNLLPLRPRSLWLLVAHVPAPAPPGARQRPALLGPRDLAAGGGWKAILTYTRKEDSPAGEDYWTKSEPRE